MVRLDKRPWKTSFFLIICKACYFLSNGIKWECTRMSKHSWMAQIIKECNSKQMRRFTNYKTLHELIRCISLIYCFLHGRRSLMFGTISPSRRHGSKNQATYRKPSSRGTKWNMGLGSALLRLGGVWMQSVGGVKRLIALYYGKIGIGIGWYWGVLEILVLILVLLRTFENIGICIGYC